MNKFRSLWFCLSGAALLGGSVDALGASSQTIDPRVDQMNLQLTRSGFGRLTLHLNDFERRRLRESGSNSLTLTLSRKDGAVDFNDSGQGADLKANDGLFSAEIPVHLDLLKQLNAE